MAIVGNLVLCSDNYVAIVRNLVICSDNYVGIVEEPSHPF